MPLVSTTRRPPATIACLTIRQPWAWAILFAGKGVENRNRRTHHRGPLAIHAGKNFDDAGAKWIESQGIVLPREFALGEVIGICDIVGCSPCKEPLTPSIWHFGPWCWELDRVREVEPFAVRGQQSLFSIDYANITPKA